MVLYNTKIMLLLIVRMSALTDSHGFTVILSFGSCGLIIKTSGAAFDCFLYIGIHVDSVC